MRLPKQATAAEAIGWLVGNLVPVRTDLSGRLTGWYRLSSGEAPIPPDLKLEAVDPELPLVLHTVPNIDLLVELTVRSDPEARFVAPMGSAVPVVTLVDHISAWLSLPPGTYRLVAPSGPLGPHSILADLDAADTRLSLVLEPVPAKETT